MGKREKVSPHQHSFDLIERAKVQIEGARQHDVLGLEASSLEIYRGSTQPSRHINRGTNGKRTTQEIFDALYTALESANGERLSVSQLADKTGTAYETCYWSMRLAERISQDWPLEVQAFRRKRYYRFRRTTRRNRRDRPGPISQVQPDHA